MGRKTKAAKHTRTLKKNIFLFLLSISILAGTTWLFLNIIELPGLPFKIDEIKPREIISAIKARFGKNEVDDRHMAENRQNKKNARSREHGAKRKLPREDVIVRCTDIGSPV